VGPAAGDAGLVKDLKSGKRDGPRGDIKLPKKDAATPRPDKAIPKKDQTAPKPDKTLPKKDQAASKPDKTLPKKDQAIPKPDKALPKPDKALPKPDKALPKPDKAIPKPDKAIPKPDAGNPPPTSGTIYYVRPKGGTSTQCTGKVNADYPGSGAKKPCAFKHPFYALPPGMTPLLKGGDTLLIASGVYRMGYGAPGATAHPPTCGKYYPWACVMPAIPSGKSKSAPTRILGEGWDKGCKNAPELYGTERAFRVFDLRKRNNIQLGCLEITDRSKCIDGHSQGAMRCDRGSYPFGDWASVGVVAEDSQNVTLRDLDIHGFAHSGIWAGRLANWTLERVRIATNGWVGWDGDLNQSSGSGNTGTMTFRSVVVEYNGCGETWPGGKPTGCWAQSAGGYGDGLGTAATGGNWVFEDCTFRHNTSDGLDLLYHDKGGKVTVRRTRLEGNAGNQLKVTGHATLENLTVIGTCDYFKGKSFTYNVDTCRSLGNPVSVEFQAGTKATLVNSTIYGKTDVLLESGVRASSCNGKETFTAINNIFIGDTDYFQPWEKANLFYQQGCGGLKLTGDYNVFWNMKTVCPKLGSHDTCANPNLTAHKATPANVTPKSGSPAISTGKPVGGLVPNLDGLKKKRPCGKGLDRGSVEVCL